LPDPNERQPAATEPESNVATEADGADAPDPDPVQPQSGTGMPPGDHPLEVAARRGIGPLSPLGSEAWHGHAKPCVSCGQLVMRDQRECHECGQDLSDEMLGRMRAHAGPWYVLDHLRPFPGVSLERIIRQIRRGVLTETSIVRGPATDFQWRFAVETPGLCRYFEKCWRCHGHVPAEEEFCPNCRVDMSFPEPPPVAAVPVASQNVAPRERAEWGQPGTTSFNTRELEALSAALDQAPTIRRRTVWDDPPQIFGIRVTWIAAFLVVAVVVALIVITRLRNETTTPKTLNTDNTAARVDNFNEDTP